MTIVWHWPQLLWLVYIVIDSAVMITRDTIKNGRDDGLSSALARAIVHGCGFALLYSGGFFLGVSP